MENRNQRESGEFAHGEYQPDGTIAADTYRSGFKAVVATYAMTIRDFVVEITPTTTATLTLPPVAGARGKIYTINHMGASTDIVTVVDKGDDPLWSDQTLNAAGENMVVFSNGRHWFELMIDES